MPQLNAPLPDEISASDFALFFDFDGTLAEIAERPDDVEVTEATRQTLASLRNAFSGAVAIVTGRDIASIDGFLAPVKLPIAGVHGLVRRDANGAVHHPKIDSDAIHIVGERLKPLVDAEPGLLLERKHGAIALHYRLRPELETVCLEAMDHAVADAPAINLRRGKMVVEAIGHSSDKGMAIAGFLEEPPFAGRRPVFVGDDLTDEDGFRMVNQRNGISIKVGAGETNAQYRIKNREELLSLLNNLLEQLGSKSE